MSLSVLYSDASEIWNGGLYGGSTHASAPEPDVYTFLLLESGSNLLQEDGSKIRLK